MDKQIRALARQARVSGSSSVVVWREGKPEFLWYDSGGQRPIELMSVTKMIVGVLTGIAFGNDCIEALSSPVAKWFPEWAGDARSAITLRHILTHTSGLDVLSPADTYASGDIIRLALSRTLVANPGAAFRYSNSTFNLLGGIVKKASGKQIDEFADERLFSPLGFSEWSWQKDSIGNPLCMAGLSIQAEDLVKVGEMLRQGGRWLNKELVAASWVEAMQPHAPANVGLACFRQFEVTASYLRSELLDLWLASGVDSELVDAARPFAGKDLDSLRRELDRNTVSRLAAAVLGRGLKLIEQDVGSAVGYGHDGDLGQYLVVMPDDHMVVVRLREEQDNKRYGTSWPTLLADVRRSFRPT